MANPLRKGPKGGEPLTERSPTKSSRADTGRARSIPRMSVAAEVPDARTRLPTTRNRSPFTNPLFSTCSTAPYVPRPPSPSPSASRPTCSTLEYASSRFTSACPMMNAAATSSEKRSEEHTSELQSQFHLGCRLPLEKNTHRKTGQRPFIISRIPQPAYHDHTTH